MDRFLFALGLAALLAVAPLWDAWRHEDAQPVFFRMLFPQLMPEGLFADWLTDVPGEAVAL